MKCKPLAAAFLLLLLVLGIFTLKSSQTIAQGETTTTLPQTVLTGFLALLSSEKGPLIGIVAVAVVLIIFWFIRRKR